MTFKPERYLAAVCLLLISAVLVSIVAERLRRPSMVTSADSR